MGVERALRIALYILYYYHDSRGCDIIVRRENDIANSGIYINITTL